MVQGVLSPPPLLVLRPLNKNTFFICVFPNLVEGGGVLGAPTMFGSSDPLETYLNSVEGGGVGAPTILGYPETYLNSVEGGGAGAPTIFGSPHTASSSLNPLSFTQNRGINPKHAISIA